VDSRISARALSALLGAWRSREPAYEALADGVRLLCLDSRVAPGTALPAERELASALAVSRTTVAAAYRSLRDTGHIESLRGSGSVTLPLARDSTWPAAVGGVESIDLQQASPPAWPGLAGVVSEVTGSASRIISRSGYDVVGREGLRKAIADRYSRRGLPTSVEQILVTTGAQSAIHLLASVLVRRGERVAIETPTYPHAAEALRRAGARLVSVPVTTDDGWDLDRAAQVFSRTLPTLAYLMPDFQNPTGRTMSPDERTVILDAATRAGSVVVVDETTADLDIDRAATPVPFGADRSARTKVLRVGSLGKTVWGGLRVGWIRADVEVVRRLAVARSAHDLGTPELEQAIAEVLVERLDDILPQRSHLLRTGRDAVAAALRARLPSWRVPDVDGGMSLWVDLPAPLSAPLVMDARSSGLLLSAGPRFGVDGGHERRLRIPFTAPAQDLERAAAILEASWERVRTGAPIALLETYDALV